MPICSYSSALLAPPSLKAQEISPSPLFPVLALRKWNELALDVQTSADLQTLELCFSVATAVARLSAAQNGARTGTFAD